MIVVVVIVLVVVVVIVLVAVVVVVVVVVVAVIVVVVVVVIISSSSSSSCISSSGQYFSYPIYSLTVVCSNPLCIAGCCPSDAVDFYHRSERVIFLTVPIRTLLSIGSAITTAMADTRKKDTLVVAISLLLSASSAILLLYAVSCLVNLCKCRLSCTYVCVYAQRVPWFLIR